MRKHLVIVFSLMLCDVSMSQSIFSFGEQGTPDYTISKDYVHGIGIYSYNEAVRDTSIKRACNNSLQSLNSNSFISVFIEIFRQNGQKYYEFPELSVKDSKFEEADSSIIVETDIYDGNLYCFTSDNRTAANYLSGLPELDQLKTSAVQVGDVWYAAGVSKEIRHNKNRSWLLSKNEAVKRLSKTISTIIQNRRVTIGKDVMEMTYFKTNVIFENLVVVKRFIAEDNYISIIAIREQDISSFTN